MGIYNLNDLVKSHNNGITAVARAERVDMWRRSEITLGQIGLVMFAGDQFFHGKYPVREAGITGTNEDLRKIETVIGEIKKESFQVPFSNAGYMGEGWQSSLEEVGKASADNIRITFAQSLGEDGAHLLALFLLKEV